MKNVVILLFILFSVDASYAANLPAQCKDLGAQVSAQVVSTAVVDLDQDQTECTFKVFVNFGETEIDQKCPIELSEIEQATFVDPSCSVATGKKLDYTTTQTFNTNDMKSRGLFYWFNFGGYQSDIVFPNYGK